MFSLQIACKTWSKNSFGLFNYHNSDSDMIKSNFLISSQDTKILRHEKQIELDAECRARNRQKNKKIIVTLTAQDSDIVKDGNTETMDLNKKNQESSQICRVMF